MRKILEEESWSPRKLSSKSRSEAALSICFTAFIKTRTKCVEDFLNLLQWAGLKDRNGRSDGQSQRRTMSSSTLSLGYTAADGTCTGILVGIRVYRYRSTGNPKFGRSVIGFIETWLSTKCSFCSIFKVYKIYTLLHRPKPNFTVFRSSSENFGEFSNLKFPFLKFLIKSKNFLVLSLAKIYTISCDCVYHTLLFK